MEHRAKKGINRAELLKALQETISSSYDLVPERLSEKSSEPVSETKTEPPEEQTSYAILRSTRSGLESDSDETIVSSGHSELGEDGNSEETTKSPVLRRTKKQSWE